MNEKRAPQEVTRRRAHKNGKLAEWVAALFLVLQFYRIKAWRLKTPVGEIDLLAQKNDILVFVEVKYRHKSNDETAAMQAVNTKRIARAAAYYVSRYPRFAAKPQRFDVIFLAPWSWPRHVKNAFDGE